MSSTELHHLIALLQIKGVGHITARNLIQVLGSSEAVFREKAANLSRIQGISTTLVQEIKKAEPLKRAEAEMHFVEKNQIKPLVFNEPDYPQRLNECVDAPLLLFYKGNADLNCKKTLSLVGTRNATEYGKAATEKLIEEISSLYPDILIISGMAYGIDIISHKAALSQNMSTIGVMAHGLDRIYPAAHRKTAVEMVTQGGLLTEYVSGTIPDRQNFVMRNRIVAGLSDALVVVESAQKGGALITAEIANSYNKDVFAIPGRITDISSEGCNNLIQSNKAILIRHAEDLLNSMGWNRARSAKKIVQKEIFAVLTDDESLISKHLDYHEAKQINTLSIDCNMPVYKLSSTLLEMEFKGLVKCMPGGSYLLL